MYVLSEEQLAAKREYNRRRYYKYRDEILAREKASRDKNPEIARARAKAYYETHKSKALEQAKKWHAANPEKVREARLKWRQNNPDKQREATRRWAKEHPIAALAKAGRYRARKVGAKGFYTIEQFVARAAYYGNMCAYCKAGSNEVMDHVIPLARGGSNWPANLRPACLQCNSSKKNRLLSEWGGPPVGGWPKSEKAVRAGKKFAVDMRVRVGHLDINSGVIF